MISLGRFLVTRLGPCLLCAGPLLAAAPVSAATYAVDAARSQLSATFRLSGVTADGQFKKFGGSAEFDPANPAQTRARFDIDTTGFDLGSQDYNAQLAGKDWFNTVQYPRATFISKAARLAGPGRLALTGILTLKGKSAELTFPVTYQQEGKGYLFEGVAPLKRLVFNIGEGEWKDTSVLDDEVRIRFKLTLVPRN
jgi:polyisoprenoid-binding protein YceI